MQFSKEEITMFMLEAKYIELNKNKVPDKILLYPYGWDKIRENEVKIRMLEEALRKEKLLFQTEEYLKYCEKVTETLHNSK